MRAISDGYIHRAVVKMTADDGPKQEEASASQQPSSSKPLAAAGAQVPSPSGADAPLSNAPTMQRVDLSRDYERRVRTLESDKGTEPSDQTQS